VQLLELAAFLAPEPIPLTLFTGHPELLAEPLRITATDPDALADTVGTLVAYSLARRSPDGFQIHRLVQAVIRQQLPSEQDQAAAERVMALLTAASPGDPENPVNWPAYAQLAPHVLITGSLADHESVNRQLLLDIARQLLAQGDGHGSRAVCEQLLDRWRSLLDPDHADTLTAASTLTLTLAQLCKAEAARVLGEDTVPRCRRMLGPDHPITLWAAAGLTCALVCVGEAEPGRALGEVTLQRCRRVLGPDHVATLLVAATLIDALATKGP
jgi:Tetratricopeptide repeat